MYIKLSKFFRNITWLALAIVAQTLHNKEQVGITIELTMEGCPPTPPSP
jgi:hypothetical protein